MEGILRPRAQNDGVLALNVTFYFTISRSHLWAGLLWLRSCQSIVTVNGGIVTGSGAVITPYRKTQRLAIAAHSAREGLVTIDIKGYY